MISDYMKDAVNAKKKLDSISPTFCLAKFLMTSINLTSGYTNSCYHCPPHKINQDQLKKSSDNIHHTPEKLQQQNDMKNSGVWPKDNSCSYCHNIEKTGQLSDRHYRSGEPWAMKMFDQIVQNNPGQKINPRYVEVNFNHACNFKCSYCSPQFSSTWEKEVKDKGSFPTKTPHNEWNHFNGVRKPIPFKDQNPFLDAFWEWWPSLYPDLKHFRLTGGEPLMDKNTYKVFDYVLSHPKPDLHLDITSNFCPTDQKLMDKYINYVKRICDNENVEHFMQFVSVDTWGNQAEYIRNGLVFDRLLENIDNYLTEVPGRNSLTIIATYNNLSVVNFRKLLEYILQLRKKHSHTYQRIWFDTPILRQPGWQSICILPIEYQKIHEENIQWMEKNLMPENSFVGFKDFEIQRMERDLTYWKENAIINDRTIMADFYRFFREHDRRRNTNFVNTFPEMKEWWQLCEHYANEKT